MSQKSYFECWCLMQRSSQGKRTKEGTTYTCNWIFLLKKISSGKWYKRKLKVCPMSTISMSVNARQKASASISKVTQTLLCYKSICLCSWPLLVHSYLKVFLKNQSHLVHPQRPNSEPIIKTVSSHYFTYCVVFTE